jgi:hypothetical protein
MIWFLAVLTFTAGAACCAIALGKASKHRELAWRDLAYEKQRFNDGLPAAEALVKKAKFIIKLIDERDQLRRDLAEYGDTLSAIRHEKGSLEYYATSYRILKQHASEYVAARHCECFGSIVCWRCVFRIDLDSLPES